jgi:ABC-type transporter Mla MlaB component
MSPENLSALQEAAVMYADGRSVEALRVLESAATQPGVAGDERPWELLFALCRAEGRWQLFDALAARFQQAFGRPAPAWLSEDEQASLPPALRSGGAAYVELSGALDRRALPRMQEARRRAAAHPSLHLDFSRTSGFDEDGARELSGLIRFLASNGNALRLTGARPLIELLRTAVSGDGSLLSAWTLLLDLYQLEGMRVEFERAALEYALAANAPAPDWAAVVMPLTPRDELREKRDEPRYQAGPEVIALDGSIEGSGDEAMHAIREFARGRRYVNIDLSRVTRMTPAAASALVQLVNGLAGAGTVRVLRANPLVATLLETLGPDPRVQLIRAQSL